MSLWDKLLGEKALGSDPRRFTEEQAALAKLAQVRADHDAKMAQVAQLQAMQNNQQPTNSYLGTRGVLGSPGSLHPSTVNHALWQALGIAQQGYLSAAQQQYAQAFGSARVATEEPASTGVQVRNGLGIIVVQVGLTVSSLSNEDVVALIEQLHEALIENRKQKAA